MQRKGSVLLERPSAPRETVSDLPIPIGALHRHPALQHHCQNQPDHPRCVCVCTVKHIASMCSLRNEEFP